MKEIKLEDIQKYATMEELEFLLEVNGGEVEEEIEDLDEETAETELDTAETEKEIAEEKQDEAEENLKAVKK